MDHIDPSAKGYIPYLRSVGIPPITKITNQIYLGSLESTNPQILSKYGITHIINAAKEAKYQSSIPQIRLILDDIPSENLFRVLEPSRIMISKILEDPENKILIHCVAGVSRSASVLIYYLMKEKNMSYDQAKRFVEEKREIVNPNKGFEKTLRSVV